MRRIAHTVALVLLLSGVARSEEASPEPSPASESIEERLARLERENEALQSRIDALARSRRPAAAPSLSLLGDVRLRIAGYLDTGFFDASGDGVSYERDAGNVERPELDRFAWVFLGDPWANPVNSQGDSADLGLDRTNIDRFDPIHSGGRPSFLVNMMNVGLVGSLSTSVLVETSLNLEPRQGALGASGDQLDIDLAYLEWIPRDDIDLHVFVGKFESTFGIEYRARKAPDRFGITPSLLSRYTMGSPTGLKVRGGIADEALTWNVALTNGGMFTEKFAHFFNEPDSNGGKTLSGRVSARAPVSFFFEVGTSAQAGTQDGQRSEDAESWQYGADLKVVIGDVTVRGEYLRGQIEGDVRAGTSFLRVEGWWAETSWQALPWAGALVRADYRHAFLFTDPNLYVTDTARLTAGLRFDVSINAIVKIEYLRIEELTGPEIDDDVMTSSVVFRF